MRLALLATLAALMVTPSILAGGRYHDYRNSNFDRGSRYDGGNRHYGKSRSGLSFGFGFSSGGYRDYSYGHVGYRNYSGYRSGGYRTYDVPVYRAPRVYQPYTSYYYSSGYGYDCGSPRVYYPTYRSYGYGSYYRSSGSCYAPTTYYGGYYYRR